MMKRGLIERLKNPQRIGGVEPVGRIVDKGETKGRFLKQPIGSFAREEYIKKIHE